MGRSKRLNSKRGREVLAAQGGKTESGRVEVAFGHDDSQGGKPQGKLVRDTRRRASSENNWLHGVLFIVIAVVVISWALGY